MANLEPQDHSGRTLTGRDKPHPSTIKGVHAAHLGETQADRRARLLSAVRRAARKAGLATQEDLKVRATCSGCLARTYRGEECVCDDGGDADQVAADLIG